MSVKTIFFQIHILSSFKHLTNSSNLLWICFTFSVRQNLHYDQLNLILVQYISTDRLNNHQINVYALNFSARITWSPVRSFFLHSSSSSISSRACLASSSSLPNSWFTTCCRKNLLLLCNIDCILQNSTTASHCNYYFKHIETN